jgi:hypothetical protein
MSAYLNPLTDMQSPKAISIWMTSKNLEGMQSIGLPQGAFGIVVYAPMEAGNSPLSTNEPSFVVETKRLKFWNRWRPVMRWSSSAVQFVLVSDGLGVSQGQMAGSDKFG